MPSNSQDRPTSPLFHRLTKQWMNSPKPSNRASLPDWDRIGSSNIYNFVKTHWRPSERHVQSSMTLEATLPQSAALASAHFEPDCNHRHCCDHPRLLLNHLQGSQQRNTGMLVYCEPCRLQGRKQWSVEMGSGLNVSTIIAGREAFFNFAWTLWLSPPKRGSPQVTTDPSLFDRAKAEEKRLDQILTCS